jgi:hypothetical protein
VDGRHQHAVDSRLNFYTSDSYREIMQSATAEHEPSQ